MVAYNPPSFSKLLLTAALAASVLLVPVPPSSAQTGGSGISVALTAPDTATVGQPITFTTTVTNDSVPQNVGLKNFLSEGLMLDSATPSQGSCEMGHHSSNAVACEFGEVPSGGSATVEVVAVPMEAGTVTNDAVAGAESAPAASDSKTVTVDPAPEN